MTFKNMKIEITDEVQLKAVCDVLESMGYGYWVIDKNDKWIGTSFKNKQFTTFSTDVCFSDEVLVTLTDLLEMRDKNLWRRFMQNKLTIGYIVFGIIIGFALGCFL